eukprot:TRINITY_DN67981_c0_g1_i1.p1 TRINITY_DN67981_c0_g1~~TRINITY_DN67981_c0_g1_i1.p1  ORF type:complete len:267 (+),score=58.31 TRINITY_DN67981_c0_g1_i1:64-801(+)
MNYSSSLTSGGIAAHAAAEARLAAEEARRASIKAAAAAQVAQSTARVLLKGPEAEWQRAGTFPVLAARQRTPGLLWGPPRLYAPPAHRCVQTTTANKVEKSLPEDANDKPLSKEDFGFLVNQLLGWDERKVQKVLSTLNTNSDCTLQAGEWQTVLHKALQGHEQSCSACSAEEAEAEEADETGYQGMLKDAQALTLRLQPFLASARVKEGFRVRAHEMRHDVDMPKHREKLRTRLWGSASGAMHW